MGKKYIIEYERPNCIGAGVCVVLSDKHFEMNVDGKADLKEASNDGKIMRKEIDEADLQDMMRAAEGCPVRVIHVIEKDTGKKLI